jgi:hypothetical protein
MLHKQRNYPFYTSKNKNDVAYLGGKKIGLKKQWIVMKTVKHIRLGTLTLILTAMEF